MEEYTKKEKLEKRFQYSLAMAGILLTAGYILYGILDQQMSNIQQFMNAHTLLQCAFFAGLFRLIVILDALLFTLAIVFVLCIVLNGIYLANIFVDKWQKKLYLLINDFFKTGFILVIIIIMFCLFYALSFGFGFLIQSFWTPGDIISLILLLMVFIAPFIGMAIIYHNIKLKWRKFLKQKISYTAIFIIIFMVWSIIYFVLCKLLATQPPIELIVDYLNYAIYT